MWFGNVDCHGFAGGIGLYGKHGGIYISTKLKGQSQRTMKESIASIIAIINYSNWQLIIEGKASVNGAY